MISASEASSSSGPEPGWEARVVEASRPIKAPASSDMPSIMATFTSETLEDTVRRTLMVHDLPLMYRDCNLVVVMVQGTMEKLLSRLVCVHVDMCGTQGCNLADRDLVLVSRCWPAFLAKLAVRE